jgi:hypothetical protein
MPQGHYYTVDDIDIDADRPRYHSHDAPMPLFPDEPPVRRSLDDGDILGKLTNVVDAMMGEGDGRRRQHSRDSRAIPTPSEISSVYFPNRKPTTQDLDEACAPGLPPLNNGQRPRAVVLDGAAALRERAIAEQVALADLNAANADFWDAQFNADRLKRR